MEGTARIAINGLFLVALAAVSACTQLPRSEKLAAAEPGNPPIEKRARVPDEYLVTLIPEVDKTVITELFGRFGIKDVLLLDGETFLLILSNDPGPQTMEDLIYDEARIKSVHPNLIYWANRSSRQN